MMSLRMFQSELEKIVKQGSFYYPNESYPTCSPNFSPNCGIVFGKHCLLMKNHYGTRDFLNKEEPYKWRINIYCENKEDAENFCEILLKFIKEYPYVGFQFKDWGEPESFCLYFEDNKSLVEFLKYLSKKNFRTIKPSEKPAFFIELNINGNPLYLFRTIYKILPKEEWSFSPAVSTQIEEIINRNLIEEYFRIFNMDLKEIIEILVREGLEIVILS